MALRAHLGIALVVLGLAAGPAAQAALPGKNGRVVGTDWVNDRADVSFSELVSAKPDGKGRRVDVGCTPAANETTPYRCPFEPGYSANGSRLTYYTSVLGPSSSGPDRLMVANGNGSAPTVVNTPGLTTIVGPTFGPDGRIF